MAQTRGFALANGWMARAAALWLCGLGFAASSACASRAQDAAPTLHVYTDLVQIPTLVLQRDRSPLGAPVAEGRFFVSFDGGPKFRATHTRLEGDDPVALSILLDLRQPFPTLMNRMGGAAAGLVPKWLTARDHVSIYSAECSFVRSATDLPADSATLKRSMDEALDTWKMRAKAHDKGDCQSPWNLWDALAMVEQDTWRKPGWRVILVVSDGLDRGSKRSWGEVKEFAQQNGIAIFGLIQPEDEFGAFHSGFPSTNDTFDALCEETGGTILVTKEWNLQAQLEQFTSLLRGRYIVEFPRPYSTTPGTHRMTITIDRMQVNAMPAGIAVPVDNPAILKDPTTVPLDPSSVPQLGKGRPPGSN